MELFLAIIELLSSIIDIVEGSKDLRDIFKNKSGKGEK